MWERVEKREHRAPGLVPGPGERPRPDLPPGEDLIPKIKHIVVLMMENHSYDNYLGMLAGRGDGLPADAAGAPAHRRQRAAQRPARRRVSPRRPRRSSPATRRQTWHASHIAYDDGSCAGFANAVWETVPGGDPAIPMGYWTGEDLPFYYGARADLPGGRPLVLLLPGADVPEPAVPDQRHRARADRRPAVGHGGLPRPGPSSTR